MEMEVRGYAVKSTVKFVEQNFPNEINQWLDSLSPVARMIIDTADNGSWYPLASAVLEPTRAVCEMFYDGHTRGAWELGRASADYVYQGMFKMFAKVGTPNYTLNRSCKIFTTYYRPVDMELIKNSTHQGIIRITDFSMAEQLLEMRMAGWMERALEIHGCEDIKIEISRSMCEGHNCTELSATWK